MKPMHILSELKKGYCTDVNIFVGIYTWPCKIRIIIIIIITILTVVIDVNE